MIGVMKGWLAGFMDKNHIFKSEGRLSWHRYGKNVILEKLGIEYYFGFKANRLQLKLAICDDEDKFMLMIGIPLLFNFYISVDTPSNRFTRWVEGKSYLGGRETGFSFGKDYVNLVFWHAMDGWSADEFCGYQLIKDWPTIFLGDSKSQLRHAILSYGEGVLPPTVNFPEGEERCLFAVKEENFERHYSRFYMFWYKPKYKSFTVEALREIVVHGKRGDEKMYPISFAAKTKAEAVSKYIERIRNHMSR